MDKKNYYNSVTDQVKALEELATVQTDRCFDLEKLDKAFGRDTAKKIKRVIVTGCGDSYSAAGAMLLGMKKLSGLRKCNSPDIMDFLCYYSPLKIAKGYAMDEVLVLAISASGGSERVAEALEKANALGCETMILTCNPDSKCGHAAKHIFNVETPAGCNTPGLRSYYASLTAIAAVGAYLGLANGTLTEEQFLATKDAIASYTKTFMADFERIDDLMFSEALRMKDLRKFEVIADGNEGYSAQFVEEKFIECGGVYCDHTNSEEFVHISYMYRCPDELGTVVMINEADKSLSRMIYSINGCLAQHRPTLIVTDVENLNLDIKRTVTESPYFKQIIGYDALAAKGTPTICKIAKAPEKWMAPFVDFIPGALLAGYHAAVNEIWYFGGRYDFRTQTWNRG